MKPDIDYKAKVQFRVRFTSITQKSRGKSSYWEGCADNCEALIPLHGLFSPDLTGAWYSCKIYGGIFYDRQRPQECVDDFGSGCKWEKKSPDYYKPGKIEKLEDHMTFPEAVNNS